MKKTSKKILLALVMALITTVTLTTLQANAVSNTTLNGIEYSSDNIPAEKLDNIVKAMYGVSDDITVVPYNLLCIFGHSKTTGAVKTTEHNYYTAAPKCKITYTDVEYCTRSGCDYFVVTGESTSRTSCH